MKINLNEITKICEILITRAKKSGLGWIEFDQDYYWYIASDDRENFEASPKTDKLPVGSLYDDISCLRQVISSENIPTIVDFDRLGNVLIAIGQRICESDKPFL